MPQSTKYGKVEIQKGEIPKKEPVFVLRAGDELTEKLIRFYAEDYLQHTSDISGYRLILSEADNFRLWPDKHLPSV